MSSFVSIAVVARLALPALRAPVQRMAPLALRTPLALLALLVLPASAAAQLTPPPGPLLVMPFENTSGQAKIFWLQEASAILLADNLNVLGVSAITRTERVHAFEALHLPAVATLSHATVIKVGQLVGAGEVILGTLDLTGDELTMRARSIRLDTGRMKAEVVERGPLPQLFDIAARVARRIAATFVISAPPLRTLVADPDPPFEAFENYIKGLIAEAPATQINYFESAIKLQPHYDRAQLELWEVRTEAGEHARALTAAQAVSADSGLYRRARFLATISRIHLKQHDEAFNGLKALLDQQAAAAVYNNMGVVQIRRGWNAQTGRPTYYFNKAVTADPTDPDYYFNLGYAYFLEKDLPATIYWLREAVRRNPADGAAHFVLGAALGAAAAGTGNAVEAAREKELARHLSSSYGEFERRPASASEQVPKSLERIKTDLQTPRALRLDSTIVSTAQREQRDLAAFHLDAGRRLFEQERDREAVTELRRSIFLSPYQAEPHLLLGRIYMRTGRVQEAMDAFKIAIWSDETVAAHLALAEAYLLNGDRQAARAEVQRALTLDPASPDAKTLFNKVGAAGTP